MPLVKLSIAAHAAALCVLAIQPRKWRQAAALVVANHAALCLAGMMPKSKWLGPNVSHLHDHERCHDHDHSHNRDAAHPWVALTLDDGPDPDVTPQVLDLLRRRQARATFFCIGRHAEAHPELIERMVAEGHRVENHTYHHWPYFAFLGSRRQESEILRAQHVIAELSGRSPLWFRAPAGIQNPLLGPVLHRLDLRLVSWTRRGFDAVERNPRRILRRLGRNLRSGDILVMHDGFGPRTQQGEPVILETLPRLLDLLDTHGLRAEPLPDPI